MLPKPKVKKKKARFSFFYFLKFTTDLFLFSLNRLILKIIHGQEKMLTLFVVFLVLIVVLLSLRHSGQD